MVVSKCVCGATLNNFQVCVWSSPQSLSSVCGVTLNHFPTCIVGVRSGGARHAVRDRGGLATAEEGARGAGEALGGGGLVIVRPREAIRATRAALAAAVSPRHAWPGRGDELFRGKLPKFQ